MIGNDRMECEKIRAGLGDYLQGIQADEVKRETEQHLIACEECRKIFNREEDRVFLGGEISGPLPDIRKIESRFTRKIVGRVLGIALLAVFGFYTVFGFLLPVLMNRVLMKKSEEMGYAIKELIQFTIPAARLKGGYEGTMTLFDIVRMSDYEQPLAGGGLRSGKVQLVSPLYLGRNRWSFTSDAIRSGSGYVFFYPQKRSGSSLDMVWEKLTKIGNGTRATAALYFEKPVDTKEMQRLMKKIGAEKVNDAWLAIDTGDAVRWEYDMDKPYRELNMHSPQWGFPMRLALTPVTAQNVTRDSSGNIIAMSGGLEAGDVPGAAENFRKEMKALEDYSSRYFNAPEFTRDVGRINDYLGKKGIWIRGAVLNAPTEDFLKLKDELNLARIDMVDVDFDF